MCETERGRLTNRETLTEKYKKTDQEKEIQTEIERLTGRDND